RATLAPLLLLLPPLSFFFLLLPRPPSSPLFPYTTLFRSEPLGWLVEQEQPGAGAQDAADRQHLLLAAGELGSLAASSRCWRSARSEEHTSELQSLTNLVCRLLLEKKKQTQRQLIATEPEQ